MMERKLAVLSVCCFTLALSCKREAASQPAAIAAAAQPTSAPVPETEDGVPFAPGISPTSVWSRFFEVRVGSDLVGHLRLSQDSFQEGAVLRTSVERWLFPDPSLTKGYAIWSLTHYSETPSGACLAFWGNVNCTGNGAKFRLQGGQGLPRLSGNLFGQVVPEQTVDPPKDFHMVQWLYRRLHADWLAEHADRELKGYRFRWMLKGPRFVPASWKIGETEPVVLADRSSVPGRRVEGELEGSPWNRRILWFDEAGVPVKEEIPSIQMTLVASPGTNKENVGRGALLWPQAKQRLRIPEDRSPRESPSFSPENRDDLLRYFLIYEPLLGF